MGHVSNLASNHSIAKVVAQAIAREPPELHHSNWLK